MLDSIVLVVNYVTQDGKSNWLEGMILMCLYVILAVTFWYYPGKSIYPFVPQHLPKRAKKKSNVLSRFDRRFLMFSLGDFSILVLTTLVFLGVNISQQLAAC